MTFKSTSAFLRLPHSVQVLQKLRCALGVIMGENESLAEGVHCRDLLIFSRFSRFPILFTKNDYKRRLQYQDTQVEPLWCFGGMERRRITQRASLRLNSNTSKSGHFARAGRLRLAGMLDYCAYAYTLYAILCMDTRATCLTTPQVKVTANRYKTINRLHELG